jgi:hypothetical protein
MDGEWQNQAPMRFPNYSLGQEREIYIWLMMSHLDDLPSKLTEGPPDHKRATLLPLSHVLELFESEAELKNVTTESEFLLVRLNADEAAEILRFKNLCDEKFGERFQQDENFRHQMFDGLLAAVENIDK